MRKIIGFIALVLLSLGLQPAAAQDDPAPYLYYYSRMLGGIIIERADGTDSRHIGADVIPPGMTGLQGLGWSPSGRYFLATGIDYDFGGHYQLQGIYLFDDRGQQPVPYLATAGAVHTAQWSPDGSDKVMIVSSWNGDPGYQTTKFFRLVDPSASRVLAEFEITIGLTYMLISPNFIWDFEAERVIFYIVAYPESSDQRKPYRVTMNFDGTVLKEPLTEDEYKALPDVLDVPVDIVEPYNTVDISPTSRYQASRRLLQDNELGIEIELPVHSQETICRKYIWDNTEQYMIVLGGTLIAGGGCAAAVVGVTDVQGQLWRELGGCSWDTPPCVSWLPPQVDVSALPPGQGSSVQLDPVGYEIIDDSQLPEYFIQDETSEFYCNEPGKSTIVKIMTEEIQYTLDDKGFCLTLLRVRLDVFDLPAVIAYEPDHQLLATYIESNFSRHYVSIWKMCPDGIGVHLLKLNSYGIGLEFTPDGQQLRAKNFNAWKIYDVDDILAAATADCEAVS